MCLQCLRPQEVISLTYFVRNILSVMTESVDVLADQCDSDMLIHNSLVRCTE